MSSFSAQVDAWVRQTEQRMTAVFRQSTQNVIGEMQQPVAEGGNMPVDTGFLRASLQASTEDMPRIDASARPSSSSYAYGASQVALVIAGAELGQTIFAGYTASYAGYVENRRGFVRLAAQRWPSIVDQVAKQLKDRVGA